MYKAIDARHESSRRQSIHASSSACIGVCVLASNGQALAVSPTLVASDLAVVFYIRPHLSPQISLNLEIA